MARLVNQDGNDGNRRFYPWNMQSTNNYDFYLPQNISLSEALVTSDQIVHSDLTEWLFFSFYMYFLIKK